MSFTTVTEGGGRSDALAVLLRCYVCPCLSVSRCCRAEITYGWSLKAADTYFIFVTGTTGGACAEKFCHVEKFQMERGNYPV